MVAFDKEFENYMFDWENQNIIYHFFKHGMTIHSPVRKVDRYYEDGIKVTFDGGNVHVWAKNKIRKVHRPANLITDCEVCYDLCNEYDNHIGYVYSK